jgi:hypothetical protein
MPPVTSFGDSLMGVTLESLDSVLERLRGKGATIGPATAVYDGPQTRSEHAPVKPDPVEALNRLRAEGPFRLVSRFIEYTYEDARHGHPELAATLQRMSQGEGITAGLPEDVREHAQTTAAAYVGQLAWVLEYERAEAEAARLRAQWPVGDQRPDLTAVWGVPGEARGNKNGGAAADEETTAVLPRTLDPINPSYTGAGNSAETTQPLNYSNIINNPTPPAGPSTGGDSAATVVIRYSESPTVPIQLNWPA